MKVQILKPIVNSGKLEPISGQFTAYNEDGQLTAYKISENYIDILNYRYIHKNVSHPLKSGKDRYFKRVHCLEFKNKTVYFLGRYGSDKPIGCHIGLTWFENQRFLWKMGDHWFQQEKNIRYIVNLLFLTLGLFYGIKK
ncbi:MAG: hypothetical protein RI922_43 [Bacteroidota bacterium]|jgi:hypothetical protein